MSNKVYLNCQACGKVVIKYPSQIKESGRVFCNKKCEGTVRAELGVGRTGSTLQCFECGAPVYVPKWKWEQREVKRFFCSRECSNNGHSKLLTKHTYEERTCEYCSSSFQQIASRKKYCSVQCSSKANLKTINSKEPKKSSTQPELLFKELLDKCTVDYEHQKSVSWKHGWKKWYDFHIPALNLLVEIDGIYWHGKNVKTKDLNKQQWRTRANDRLKNFIAKKRGFNLLRIWSDDINTLNLKETLRRYEQTTCSDQCAP